MNITADTQHDLHGFFEYLKKSRDITRKIDKATHDLFFAKGANKFRFYRNEIDDLKSDLAACCHALFYKEESIIEHIENQLSSNDQ